MRNLILLALCVSFGLVACSNNQGTDKSGSVNSGETYQPSIKSSIKIILAETMGEQGDTVCIPVKVEDFHKILSMQYSINWDPGILSFQSVKDYQLSSLNSSNFGLTMVETGKLGISWYDPSLKSVSLPDGNAIFSLCFVVTGAKGQSTKLVVSGDPVAIEVANIDERILGIPSGKGKFIVR